MLILVQILLLASCSPGKPESSPKSKDPNYRIVEEYYPDGRLKSSTEAVGKLRHGDSKEYRPDGTLESQVSYRNNRKHGPARSYYPDGKTVKTEINYADGFKQGETNWYYPDGKIYRTTQYLDGKIQGTRKIYYEDGKLQAEIPYKDSQLGIGLKEYTSAGSLKKYTSTIVFGEMDRVSLDNTFRLAISLSDNYKNVEFFRGKLTEGVYWNEQLSPIPTENGTGIMDFHISKGSFKMETINIIARIKTPLNNYRILQREYHLALENKH
jgi:hypothetical protein